jgi:hypothetical protein
MQDFAAIDWLGPVDAQAEAGRRQTGWEKAKAADIARTEAYLLIQIKLSYTFNAWYRDTLAAIIQRYGEKNHKGKPRGLGNTTFSAAIKSLVIDGLVIDYGGRGWNCAASLGRDRAEHS